MSVRKGIVVAVHGLLNFPTCILICIIGDRWLQAAGIFAQTKRVPILPVVPTASCLLTDGNPKMILSKCFLLSLPLWAFLTPVSDEHYRRSSDCSFFVFASKKPKTSRSKKLRTSKASSRLSTQSAAYEAPTVDLDDQTDQSIISETTAKPKNTKKSSKSKSKSTKSKKEDTVDIDDQMDVDDVEDTKPEPPKSKRATRGKKRSSDQVDQGDVEGNDADTTEQPEPVPKRRATKTRNSAIQQNSGNLTQEQDEATPQEEEPKKGRRTKKTASSKSRKRSETSISKPASNSRVPGDAELDAALEADLEKDDEPDGDGQDTEVAKKQISKKSKDSKTSKSVPEAPVDQVHPSEEKPDETPGDVQMEPVETKSSKNTSKRGTKKSKSQDNDRKSRTPPEVGMEDAEAIVPEHHESFVSVEVKVKDPAQISEAESINERELKKSKKASADKGKKSKKPGKSSDKSSKEEHVENVQESTDKETETPDHKEETEEEPEQEQQIENRSSRRRSSNIPPKTVERYSDIHEKQFSRSLTESRTSDIHDDGPNDTSTPSRQASGAISPLPTSPQSSDAENQPPSSKPSASRAARSPSKQPSVRAPLAVSTPSPSKRNADAGSLKTSRPWAPIDIESILFARGSDKENAGLHGKTSGDLSSPEKKMTVEEWIKWNAKNGEEQLKQECERLVSHFEKEGGRAMRVLEGIECID